MPSRVFIIGSLNVDHVYRVEQFSRPGEAVSALEYSRFAGGKGANQSLAAARAGCEVVLFGKVGREGRWMLGEMSRDGVDTTGVVESGDPGGHAVIQVDREGQNTIVVFGGTNRQIQPDEIDRAFSLSRGKDLVLLQNEINHIPRIMEEAAARGLPVFFNAAPMDKRVFSYPLELVSTFFLNVAEGEALTGKTRPEEILEGMLARFPGAVTVLTLGENGAVFENRGNRIQVAGRRVNAVDTTGAGDTFIGFYMAGLCRDEPAALVLERANLAASLCVSRKGAADSIPRLSELPDKFMEKDGGR